MIMLKTLKKYNTIFWTLRRMHLMRTLEVRADFYFWAIVSTIWTIFNTLFFVLITNVAGEIGGWNIHEIYLLLGVFNIADAFIWSFFYHNMTRYTQAIFNGELNNYLLKPINTQFLVMTYSNNYTNIFRFFIGIGMVLWSLQVMNIVPSILQIGLFLVTLLLSLICLYFTWFILSTCAFYFEKLDNINEIFPNLRRMLQVPRTIYPGFLAVILQYVIPLALITSLPTEVLLGRDVMNLIVYFFFFTLCIMYASHIIFQYSVKKYSGIAN